VKLLLVEDNVRLRMLLADSLRQAGYEVDIAGTVAELLNNIAVVQYDLIIVDLGLPDGDGLSAIRGLRSLGYSMPFLIITARGSIEDRVVGLDSGADDYLIKPFYPAEFVARVRALLRRPSELQGPVIKFGGVELDEARGEVSCSGKPLEVRLSERRLLAVLIRRSGRVVPKSKIEDALSQMGRDVTTNAVEVLVSRLRKTLIEDATGVTIESVRGVGYRLHVIGRP
jgi:two-component system response regulator TctD